MMRNGTEDGPASDPADPVPAEPAGTDRVDIGGGYIVAVLSAILFLGCLVSSLLLSLAASPAGIVDALTTSLTYSVFVLVFGFVPICLHAYYYRTFLLERNVGYLGAALIASLSVVLFFGVFTSLKGNFLTPATAMGLIYALPTALVGHRLFAKRRQGLRSRSARAAPPA